MQKKNSNPFAYKAKQTGNKNVGKRVGKSKPGKANNQRNRVLTKASGSYKISNGRFISENK